MLTAQDRVKELPRLDLEIFEKKKSFLLRKQASHTVGCNSVYSCKSIFRNFSSCSVFELVSEERSQQNSVFLRRQTTFKIQIRTTVAQLNLKEPHTTNHVQHSDCYTYGLFQNGKFCAYFRKCINRRVLQCKVLIVSQELRFGPDNVGKGTLISERNVQRKHTNYVKNVSFASYWLQFTSCPPCDKQRIKFMDSHNQITQLKITAKLARTGTTKFSSNVFHLEFISYTHPMAWFHLRNHYQRQRS